MRPGCEEPPLGSAAARLIKHLLKGCSGGGPGLLAVAEPVLVGGVEPQVLVVGVTRVGQRRQVRGEPFRDGVRPERVVRHLPRRVQQLLRGMGQLVGGQDRVERGWCGELGGQEDR